jgi:hypothetical protein
MVLGTRLIKMTEVIRASIDSHLGQSVKNLGWLQRLLPRGRIIGLLRRQRLSFDFLVLVNEWNTFSGGWESSLAGGIEKKNFD